jgi:hypothetical protein
VVNAILTALQTIQNSNWLLNGRLRTVVWEGRSREAPPYPDQSPTSHAFRDLVLVIVSATP